MRGETAGGRARHLLLMTGSIRDDCIDNGTVQLSAASLPLQLERT